MTILHALTKLYDRLDRRGQRDGLAVIPPPGLKFAEIDFVLEIDREGQPLALKSKIPANGRRGPKLMVPGTAFNPKPAKGEPIWEDLSFRNRTSGRRSYLFWDKSSYLFGVAAKKNSKPVEAEVNKKSREDFEAFVAGHRQLLADQADPDFQALLRFLETWSPDRWTASGFTVDALDKNIAIQVTGARGRIDEKIESRALARNVVAAKTEPRPCILSDSVRPYAAAHPQFRGVRGAQSSGASLVSFNWDAFESYGQDKAETAPVSEEAAFKYGAALSWLLDRANSRAFRLGETTVVFWADETSAADGEVEAVAIEDELADLFGTPVTPSEASDEIDEESEDTESTDETDVDAEQELKMVQQADDARTQRAAPDIAKLAPNTRLHILGLSPNAGRIAVRFWLVDTWGHIAENIAAHHNGMHIEPKDHSSDRKPYALLYEMAVLGEAKNIVPRLGGELARAVLTSGTYPRTLYAALIARIRADKTVNAARAGLCKAIINREQQREDLPVALNSESSDSAYNLGRLFACYEYAERSVAERNASVKDKYVGAASATPRRVFPILMRGYEHNASVLAKGESNQRGAGIKASKAVRQILDRFGEVAFPTALALQDQGRFFVGYYHQLSAFYTRSIPELADPVEEEDAVQ